MVDALVNLAMGVGPEKNPRMKVNGNHVIAAWREIQKLVRVQPMDQAGAGAAAMEHLQSYQPKTVNPLPGGPGVHFTQINQYLYQPGRDDTFGAAPEDLIIEHPDEPDVIDGETDPPVT